MDWEGAATGASRRWLAGLGVCVLITAGVLSRTAVPDGPGPLDIVTDVQPPAAPPAARPDNPLPAAAAAAVGTWSALEAPPLAPRGDNALVWTGRDVVVWGGTVAVPEGRRALYFNDGAAYDPRAGTWRALPPAPLSGRTGMGAVWTGTRLFVWGGADASGFRRDGALYDPAARTWTRVPPSPLSPRAGAVLAWTGREVLVVGGSDLAGGLDDGAAFDPATATWRRVAALPWRRDSTSVLSGTWVGSHLLVWRHDAPFDSGQPHAAVYDPARDAWTVVPPPAVRAAWMLGAVGGDGRAFVAVATRGRHRLLSLDVAGGTWRDLGGFEGFFQRWRTHMVWTGRSVLFVARSAGHLEGLRYDAERDEWAELPLLDSHAVDYRGVWAADRLVVGGLVLAADGGDLALQPQYVQWRR